MKQDGLIGHGVSFSKETVRGTNSNAREQLSGLLREIRECSPLSGALRHLKWRWSGDMMRDCIIIGGGPAGLTAAIYLARYHLSTTVFDDHSSRAATIPISHNLAGFPDGISGRELVARMRTQLQRYKVQILTEGVSQLRKEQVGFRVLSSSGSMRAQTVLLATGVTDRKPPMLAERHDEAVARGLIRYCPVCDGFEVTDRRVAVIGCGSRAFAEALFLRSYTTQVTIITPQGEHELSEIEVNRLRDLRIGLQKGPIKSIDPERDAIRVATASGIGEFSSIYPALGSDARSKLAAMVGAELSENGCVIVDSHQRSTLPGLYAAGDVVIGLDQIGTAMGQAGIAATAIRNDLNEARPLAR
ncbi:NAD(P)/FAD-dependent oxidoreductase [Rhizobium lentis]|uniref:Thioredoxin reductase n=1 Tax=Rhizobium lentis TaxID=1138194 RepID=A0A7W8XKM4_9HYPH|nr:NAD(P)/FAD-dependent oxidoreductase [Rhizobium lentis]MBB4577447.1 thioredoxin reductase (NADPH) [Rhizobium lentis]MBB5554004.1 thioredoxin reductase (NADPH) [Rhizobium lentis]MBB5564637.1 thioredoxin reductase (NADPH) [Rhizobium lentis]MBB5571117.1 thioredoxin reductase (NADPH) [Rhizobium lentis]